MRTWDWDQHLTRRSPGKGASPCASHDLTGSGAPSVHPPSNCSATRGGGCSSRHPGMPRPGSGPTASVAAAGVQAAWAARGRPYSDAAVAAGPSRVDTAADDRSSWGCPRHVWRRGRAASAGFALDDGRQLPLSQGLPAPTIAPVPGIRHPRPGGHFPGQLLSDQVHGQLSSTPRGRARQHAAVRGPLLIVMPSLGHRQAPVERTTRLGTPPMQAHGDLAGGPLPQRAAGGPDHPDQMPAGFGQGGCIDAPHVQCAEPVDPRPCQSPLSLVHCPTTLPDKRPQRLCISLGEAGGQRCHRWTVTIPQ